MPTETTATPPVPFLQLKDIVHDACDAALSDVSSYDHSRAESWNSEIISNTLKSLLTATTPAGSPQPPFKYSITSTIIQHLPSTSKSTSTGTDSRPASSANPAADTDSAVSSAASGRRGMHAAAGAYWDNTKDGMWSYKYEAAGGKGLDVVVAIIWIWVGGASTT